MKQKKVGIFGGTFDPIHNGHLHLALSIQEMAQLDEVIFVPALLSPFKEDRQPKASAEQRLAMLQFAIAPIPQFSIFAGELSLPAPSYTIRTIETLSKQSLGTLHLILSDETFRGFPSWNEPDRIVELAPLLIGTSDSNTNIGWFQIPRLEISSTLVRSRLKEKLYCGHLVPAPVLNYIFTKKLYAT